MGMYDTVKRPPIECPTCGKVINLFQTKSGICQFLTVTEKQLIADAERFDVEQPYYYGYCDDCRTRVDFEWIPGHWEQTHETAEERKKSLQL